MSVHFFISKKILLFFTLSVLLLSLPIFSVEAATINAGVVNGVWLSNPEPKDGESIRIFTAVQNQSETAFNGTVVFLVNSEVVGSKDFTVKSNTIIPVSIQYTFTGGKNEVSAYITATKDQNVISTTALKTSVSVVHNPSKDAPTVEKDIAKTATSTIAIATNTLIDTGKSVLSIAEPLSEATANRIESFRDILLTATTTETTQTSEKPTQTTTKGAAQEFLASTKSIAQTSELPLWKKGVGIVLTLLALLSRIWFIGIILLFGFIFWRSVRGVRIR